MRRSYRPPPEFPRQRYIHGGPQAKHSDGALSGFPAAGRPVQGSLYQNWDAPIDEHPKTLCGRLFQVTSLQRP